MTMTPEEAPRPMVQIVQMDTTSRDRLTAIVRCLEATRLGARFRCVSQHGRVVDLALTEIRRYPQVTVTEVDGPHSARLVFTGPGANHLHFKPGDILQGINPAA